MKSTFRIMTMVFAILFLIYFSIFNIPSGVAIDENPASVVTMYLTIKKGDPSDNTDYTWKQINDFTKFWGLNDQVVVVDKTEAIVQFGDESGPLPGELGYGAIMPNGTIQIRGASHGNIVIAHAKSG